MSNVAISLIFAFACFAGVGLIARANHQAATDPLTGRSPKYWQPWRLWAVAIVLGIGGLYAAFIAVLTLTE